MPDTISDVLVVGYGPVGKTLAIMLGQHGRSVDLYERWPEIYPLPRAVCLDHELYRVLSAIGFGDDLRQLARPAPRYQWFNADWDELLCIDSTAESVSGGSQVNFVHQPSLEAAMDRTARSQPTVTLNLGWEAVGIENHADHVALTVKHMETGETRVARGRYLIGADGANSMVRQAAAIGREDRHFEADWLVVDMELNEGVVLDIPACGQYCNPERPTTIVPGGIHNGRICRRWEFMRLPHEQRQDLESTDFVWSVMGRWVRPDQATLIRHAVYTFRGLIADEWRRGRMLLVGDAAHLMPPFMGQGMCAGLRDDWNLAWKLNLVLEGKADATLLDTYRSERRPHASQVVDLSIHLGKIICVPDPAEAAARDRAYLEGTAPPPPPFPHLTDGLLHRGADNQPLLPAGLLGPHGTIFYHGREGRWDDLVGLGFAVISIDAEPRRALRDDQLQALDQLGAKIVRLRPIRGLDPDAAVDLDAKYLPFMLENGVRAMITRPDFYVFGGVRKREDLPELVDSLLNSLRSHGWKGAAADNPARDHAPS